MTQSGIYTNNSLAETFNSRACLIWMGLPQFQDKFEFTDWNKTKMYFYSSRSIKMINLAEVFWTS
jgi:hypothetical protein